MRRKEREKQTNNPKLRQNNYIKFFYSFFHLFINLTIISYIFSCIFYHLSLFIYEMVDLLEMVGRLWTARISSNNVLELRRCQIKIPSIPDPLISDLSFFLSSGDHLLISGPSGCGKVCQLPYRLETRNHWITTK